MSVKGDKTTRACQDDRNKMTDLVKAKTTDLVKVKVTR